jgi:hypothetical protein
MMRAVVQHDDLVCVADGGQAVGRNRLFCRVVKAIRVPMVTAPAATGRPAAS